MRMARNLAEAVGNTPLIRLRRASEETGCEIWGKCEFLNPGQSVKDRAALYIIRDAVARSALAPGGTIVEGTAGNTGIGLALVAGALGYKALIVMPRGQSAGRPPSCGLRERATEEGTEARHAHRRQHSSMLQVAA